MNEYTERTIKQIMPAPGWKAVCVFIDDKGESHSYLIEVVGFALTRVHCDEEPKDEVEALLWNHGTQRGGNGASLLSFIDHTAATNEAHALIPPVATSEQLTAIMDDCTARARNAQKKQKNEGESDD